MNKNKYLLLLVSSLLSLSSCGISIYVNSSSSASSSFESTLVSSEEKSVTSSAETTSSKEETATQEDSSSEEQSSSNVDDDFAPDGYSLYWSDEFDGNKLIENNWEYMIGNGNGGWGNNEAQYYTDQNDVVSDGTLKIYGRRESITDKERERTFNYTSTRIRTYNKVYTTYGYIAARIKLSAVKGLWPAFWMLPETGYGQTGTTWWPTSGEIDIMENQGRV
ncbi:MAG: glycoside hydrolase family 16 protein, partial [Bacilli bacterium]|nr:glycoside hydrolase family 16 protein [Bacilli bacterium]